MIYEVHQQEKNGRIVSGAKYIETSYELAERYAQFEIVGKKLIELLKKAYRLR